MNFWTRSRLYRLRRISEFLHLHSLEVYCDRRLADLNWQRKSHLWPVRSLTDIDILGDS